MVILISSAVRSPIEQVVLALDVLDDGLVHLVAADAHGLRKDDAGERDDGDLGGAAADVDDHVAGRLGDRQARADGRGHGLFDQVDLAGAGGLGRLSRTARFSTSVMPKGTQMMMRGRTSVRRLWTFWMK